MASQPVCLECGWVGKPTTPARADFSARRHRCERERLRRDMAARATARRSADGVHRDCAHKVARHVHGTRAAYVLDRCRCRACRDGNRAAERDRARQMLYGRWEPYIDAAPASAHIAALRAGGMGLKRIAAVSGVAHGTLWKLVDGKRRADGTRVPSRRVRPATAAKILAVRATVDVLAPVALVDACGTRRRLQALHAIGWSGASLATRLGMAGSNFPRVMRTGQVYAVTARHVRALYDELWDSPPPETNQRERISAARARNLAASLGWAPPMAWDDETMDSPRARPSGLAGNGGHYLADLAQPVAWYHAKGLNDRQIDTALHVGRETIRRVRLHLGLASPGRQLIAQPKAIVAGPGAKHGTDGGYYAHLRSWQTTPCRPCRDAHAVAGRERSRRAVGAA